jgi:hypothetical protein
MDYGTLLGNLKAACGPVETHINGVTPSTGQLAFLAFLQGPLNDAITTAGEDSEAV